MTDNNQGVAVCLEVGFKPDNSLEIQVIGGLFPED